MCVMCVCVCVCDVCVCVCVQDSASETLRQCRLRVRQLTTRLNNLLKGYGGEVTEKGGRVCVGLPAGEHRQRQPYTCTHGVPMLHM